MREGHGTRKMKHADLIPIIFYSRPFSFSHQNKKLLRGKDLEPENLSFYILFFFIFYKTTNLNPKLEKKEDEREEERKIKTKQRTQRREERDGVPEKSKK